MTAIDVLTELHSLNIVAQHTGENEVRIPCPFHADTHPSLCLNTETGHWKCHVSNCGTKGDFISLYAALKKIERPVAIEELDSRYDLNLEKTLSPDVIEKAHQCIEQYPEFVTALENRAVTKALRKKYRLGVHKGRISIPITNRSGRFVNMRLYLPGANDKYRNYKGFGELRLFPLAQLDYPKIVLTGGELKAIVAAEQLNSHGIGAICFTSAEGTFTPELLKAFRGKEVVVCFDIDDAGVAAAAKLASALYVVADSVWILNLPLDKEVYPTGDINDYVAKGESLVPLVASIFTESSWRPETVLEPKMVAAKEAVLDEVLKGENNSVRVSFDATITSKDTSPYIVPKQVTVECGRNHKSGCCAICPVNATREFTVAPESPAVLEMIGSSNVNATLAKGLNIPGICKQHEITVQSSYTVEDVIVASPVDLLSTNEDRQQISCAIVDQRPILNETFKMEGRMYPHPRTQQATLIVSSLQESSLNQEGSVDLSGLELFQPVEWTLEGIENRLSAIQHDLSYNVTRIFSREDMLMIMDWVWHSSLFIELDNEIQRGWVEGLIVGDSAQGKSIMMERLRDHYRLGLRMDCKNASLAGLVGGLEQHGTRWFVSWGIFPQADRRLVVLEELKGMAPELFGALTDMRSRGVAELTKIKKSSTSARARLLAISNPPGRRTTSSYNIGCEVIRDLIPAPEDIRRFDIAYVAEAGVISEEEINTPIARRKKIKHRYTSDACNALLKWIWKNSKPALFDEQAVEICFNEAINLSHKFSNPEIPLIDSGSTRWKLAKLAAATAGRTFSISDEGRVFIRPCHVQFAVKKLEALYTQPCFGYGRYNERTKQQSKLIKPERLESIVQGLPYAKDFIRLCLGATIFSEADISMWAGIPKEQANGIASLFIRCNAIQTRTNRGYVKTAAFTQWLKAFDLTSIKPTPEDF